jgi:hypothetical protein
MTAQMAAEGATQEGIIAQKVELNSPHVAIIALQSYEKSWQRHTEE